MDNVPDVIKEMIQGHDYDVQSKEERITFNRQMIRENWEPLHDRFGDVYRWRHTKTGRMIDDSLAFNSWLPNYHLPESEKPALG